MKSAKSKRQLTLLTLVAALGVAVYLNWEYAKADVPFSEQPDTAVHVSATVPTEKEQAENEESTLKDPLPDKNYGDAQLVSAGGTEKYFEQARLTRTKTRDEALDSMQQALKNAALTEDEKSEVTQTLTQQINSITVENSIENVVKAKGFADCVAFVDGEKVNLAVKTGSEGLTAGEVAQLRDIILGKTDTSAQNISIVEVK